MAQSVGSISKAFSKAWQADSKSFNLFKVIPKYIYEFEKSPFQFIANEK